MKEILYDDEPLVPMSGAVTIDTIDGKKYMVIRFSEFVDRLVLSPREARLLALEALKAELAMEMVSSSIEDVTLDLRTKRSRESIVDPVQVIQVQMHDDDKITQEIPQKVKDELLIKSTTPRK